MKKLIVTLSTLAVLASSALAEGFDIDFNHNGKTYKERYGVPRFTPAEIAQRKRDDEDYERNGKLYEQLDEINEKLDALEEIQNRLNEIDDQ